MSSNTSTHGHLSAQSRVLSAEGAAALVETALAALDVLEPLIMEETALLREGQMRDALKLSAEKAGAAATYTRALEALKGNAITIGRFAPDGLALLRLRHESFSELLAYNMAVLTTARSVSEGIIREVSTEVAARSNPVGYGANGLKEQRNQHKLASAPIAVSKAV